ncbi:hypothetical protein [Mucilaginibacter sp. CSA2-8R]|jgi:hypothetical protein|uniref:hypothetical protein n=1 Tax=Mucilaginibacter sp. CSA2-8R TaxID=3141542 RepID=UPI00315DF17C
MTTQYQHAYIALHRWIIKNFGGGKIPQPKSLFNTSFLLIILLTGVLLTAQFMAKSHLVHMNLTLATCILVGMVFFTLLNYYVLLNNKWMASVNNRLALLSRRNKNIWSVVLLINVIAICILSVALGR